MLEVDEARALEESLLGAAVRQSPQRLALLIADDFLEFGSSGRVFSKQDVLEAATSLPDIVTPLADLQVAALAGDAVLVTYRSTTRQPDGSSAEALRSSVWVHRDGCWQIRFHQGTPTERRTG